MAYRSSTSLTGATGTNAAFTVPAGAAVGDIAVVGIYKENTAAVTTVPSGFTLKSTLNTSATARGSLYVFWKRLTAADTGTYTFSWVGSTFRGGACGLWSGRVASGDPFDGTVGTAQSTTTVTTLNVSTSPAAASGDAVGMWTDFTEPNTWTAPGSYTERQDTDVITLDTRDAVASGSTGNVTATASASGFMKAFLGVLAAASGASVSGVADAQFGALTASATGAPVRDGVGAASFGALTASAAGVPTVVGVAAAPLGSLTASASGLPTVGGVAAAPLGALSATAAGTPTVSGVAVAALGALTGSAFGGAATTGVAVASLGALAASASGVPTVSGVAVAAFGVLTASASGTPTVLGVAVASLGALSATASGTSTVFAVAVASLGALSASAAGDTIGAGAGVAAAQLGALSAAASGSVAHPGSAVAVFGALSAAAAGSVAHAGVAVASLGGLTASAAGTRAGPGSAAALLGSLTATVIGTVIPAGTVPGAALASFGALVATAFGVGTTPAVTGIGSSGWGSLSAILAESRAESDYAAERVPVACPNDGEPLRAGPDGVLFCPYDGWSPFGSAGSGGASVGSTSGGSAGWGSLSAILAEARTETDYAAERVPASCPNDGEPLRAGPDGVLYCPYDGWRPE